VEHCDIIIRNETAKFGLTHFTNNKVIKKTNNGIFFNKNGFSILNLKEKFFFNFSNHYKIYLGSSIYLYTDLQM
jgi:hypothetical protein